MKINPIASPNILKSYLASKPAPTKQKTSSGRDELTLTDEALGFSKAMEQAREVLEFRSPEEKEHIANITNAIRQGTYSVPSEDVAAKILESVLGR